jgi:diguanylate cyclase (GGDEF)-like protein/PAS domain S-box-containing protein
MSKITDDNLKEYYRYKYIVENIKDIIWEMDSNLIFTFISPTSKDMVGYEADEMVGRCMLDFLSNESKNRISEQWKQKILSRVSGDSKEAVLLDVQFICKDGRKMWVEVSAKPVFIDEEFRGYIGTTRDISEKKLFENKLGKYIKELRTANVRLEELATFDMLTGAYNRRKFEQYIKSSVDIKEKYKCDFSIIMFDIDYFKQINDICGHNNGDKILQDISTIVKNTLRDTDKLFRWGGDEFIILLPGTTLKDAYKVAEKVRSSIESNNFGMQCNKVTVSFGVGEYKNGDTIDQYVSNVDKALFMAKSNGRNRVECS